MQTIDHTIEVLDSLLRGEIAAVESYSLAIHKFPGLPAQSGLLGIRSDHLESVEILRRMIKDLGGKPSTKSGVWGSFAKTVAGAAAVFGETPAMLSLKQGEDQGLHEYGEALADQEVDPDVKDVIRVQLLPPLQEHLLDLDSMAA